jgi:hypothetical protein
MSICCECCVLSGRGLCDELIIRPEESYRLCCVVVCDLENLVNVETLAHWGGGRGLSSQNKKKANKQTVGKHIYECPKFVNVILNLPNF